jgi:hypothetical protein
MLFETHSAIAPFTITGHDTWRQWYIGGMGGKSFIFTYDSVYSEFVGVIDAKYYEQPVIL